MESLTERSGDNLYPLNITEKFGDVELDLDVPAGVWNPTPHGVHLGHMLATLDFTGQRVLELGTGCGIHAIVIARRGAASLMLTEIDDAILHNAKHNLAKHDVNIPVEFLVADWTTVAGGPYDALVANPPFAKSGKRYRRYFIDTLILEAHKLVRPGGSLTFVQSSMADVPKTIEQLRQNGMRVEVVGETDGPFRQYYFEDPEYLREMASIPGAYDVRGGTHYERLIVLRAILPSSSE